MSRGKYQSKRKPFPILSVALIVMLVVALTTGGAVAYLTKSADTPVQNTFETAPHPTLTVNSDNSVSVAEGIGYPVYIRAAVVPNWKYNSQIIVAAPGTFTITLEENSAWFLYPEDGFYYYSLPVQPGGKTAPIYDSVTDGPTTKGTLVVDIAAQAIQAVGTTDVTAEKPKEKSAVLDAWGVPVQTINPAATPTDPIS